MACVLIHDEQSSWWAGEAVKLLFSGTDHVVASSCLHSIDLLNHWVGFERNSLGQLSGIPWNQESDVHRGFTLIT